MKIRRENILIEKDGVLKLISPKEFDKLSEGDLTYKLIGTIRPRYSRRFLTPEQKEHIILTMRKNPGKFHYLGADEVIKNIKSIVFNEMNG